MSINNERYPKRNIRVKKKFLKKFGSLADHQRLYKEYTNKNLENPESINLRDRKVRNWKCIICGFKWNSSVKARMRKSNENNKYHNLKEASDCPKCSAIKGALNARKSLVKKKGSLINHYPEIIINEWDYKKNLSIKPELLTIKSGKNVWWLCPRHKSYPKSPFQRFILKENCPKCNLHTFSRPELRLYCEIKSIFKNTLWRYKSERKEIDVFLKDYNIGFELDGHYHINRDKIDKNKNNFFSKRNIKIIRLRDHRLRTKISDNDIFVNTMALNIDDIKKSLKNLTKIININDKELKLIEKYLTLKNFSNEKYYRNMLTNLPIIPDQYNLKVLYPMSIKEWHYEKNFPERPEYFYKGAKNLVWWKCIKKKEEHPKIIKYFSGSKHLYDKHEDYQQVIKDHANNHGCRKCARISQTIQSSKASIKKFGSLKKYPKVFKEIKSTKIKNQIKDILHQMPANSGVIKFEFYCKIHDLSWNASLRNRCILKTGCRACNSKN